MRRARRTEQGSAVLELALAAPVVLFLALGVVTLTQVAYVHLHLSGGVRAGARYAARADYDPSASPATAARRRTSAEARAYTAEASQPAGLSPTACDADGCISVAVVAEDGTPLGDLADATHGDVVTVRAERRVANGLYRLAADATNAVGAVLGAGPIVDPAGVRVRAEAVTPVE